MKHSCSPAREKKEVGWKEGEGDREGGKKRKNKGSNVVGRGRGEWLGGGKVRRRKAERRGDKG